MTSEDTTGLQTTIDQLYVINLESRPDRLRDMLAELGRIGLGADSPFVKIFAAIRPHAAGAFPSIGARGCFLSQLGALQHARDNGYRAILILEDDAAFTSESLELLEDAMGDLNTIEWSFAYLGHRIEPDRMPGHEAAHTKHWRRLGPETGVVCAHAVLIHRRAIGALIDYLERMLARPAGHLEGGAMHVDGAYSWFRRDHPDLLTVVTPEQYVVQRASRSDIAPPSWKEKLPFLGLLRQLKNVMSKKG